MPFGAPVHASSIQSVHTSCVTSVVAPVHALSVQPIHTLSQQPPREARPYGELQVPT